MSPCEQSLFYLFLSFSFLSFISFLYTRKKEALHKSSPSFEVALVLGLVIPVYSGSSNWFFKRENQFLGETDGRN